MRDILETRTSPAKVERLKARCNDHREISTLTCLSPLHFAMYGTRDPYYYHGLAGSTNPLAARAADLAGHSPAAELQPSDPASRLVGCNRTKGKITV